MASLCLARRSGCLLIRQQHHQQQQQQRPLFLAAASPLRAPQIRLPSSRALSTLLLRRSLPLRSTIRPARWSPAACSTAAALAVCPIYLRLYHQPTIAFAEQSTPTAQVLAHSAAASLSDADDPHRNLLQRIAQWLIAAWRQCQDAVFIAVRGTEVVLRLSPLLLLTPASLLAARLSPTSDTTWMADATWSYTRSAITSLGPAFVKLFQWVATRRDMFPPHVCDRLAVLHDHGVAHAYRHTERTLRDAFGDDYAERGLHIDPNNSSSSMVGVGSAAQVYRGTLLRDGVAHPVAVKVLHPRLSERVTRDLHFCQTVAEWLHALPFEQVKLLNLPRAVDNFGAILFRQADLRTEANNLNQFRKNFYRNEAEEKESSILFPKPMEGWVHKNVLVEDLVIHATPISEFLKDSTEKGREIRKELASPLLRAFLKMVFLDNFVHCDLHAGNVLIQTTTVERKRSAWSSFWNAGPEQPAEMVTKRQIVFIDAGIATSLSPNDQRNLVDLFRAVILNDGNKAGRLMVERAANERCSQIPGGIDRFASGIGGLVSEFHERRKEGLTLGAVRIGSLLSRVLDLCREYGVEIDPSMSSIVISTLVLEGLGRSLAPELNLIDFAVPFVLGRGRV